MIPVFFVSYLLGYYILYGNISYSSILYSILCFSTIRERCRDTDAMWFETFKNYPEKIHIVDVISNVIACSKQHTLYIHIYIYPLQRISNDGGMTISHHVSTMAHTVRAPIHETLFVHWILQFWPKIPVLSQQVTPNSHI